MRGPIDFVIVGFNNYSYNGDIKKQVQIAQDEGYIKLLDVGLIVKDDSGVVKAAENPNEELAQIVKGVSAQQGVISQEDIDEAGEKLENGTSAGLLIIEHLWAIPLKIAILQNGGQIIADGRIHPDAAEELK